MIGERIQQARKASGLSLRALAETTGVTAMAISKYENDQSTPSSDVLLALGKALDVRVEYFFRQAEVKLEQVDYRHHLDMPEKVKGKALKLPLSKSSAKVRAWNRALMVMFDRTTMVNGLSTEEADPSKRTKS